MSWKIREQEEKRAKEAAEKPAKEAEQKEKRAREELEKRKYINDLILESSKGINHKAMTELARRYLEGDEIEKNYVEAFYWVYKAEILGSPDAPNLRKKIEKLASDIQKTVAQKRLTEEG